MDNFSAEEEGFEPPVRFPARRFSRPVHSTSSATLPGCVLYNKARQKYDVFLNKKRE